MATWNQIIITNAGKAMLAQALADSELVSIDHMTTSAHDYSAATVKELEILTRMQDEKQTFPVSDKEIVNATMLKITGSLSNLELSESYKLQAIGAYGHSGNGADTLIAIAVATEPDTISPVSNKMVETNFLEFYIKLESTDMIDLQMDMDVYALRKDVWRLVYPVGSVYFSDGTVNPNELFGGTWAKVEGRYIMASGEYGQIQAKAMATGGTIYKANTWDEMPPHVHNKGEMNIWGSLPLPTHTGRWDRYVQGAFTTEGGNGGSVSHTVEGADFDESSKWWDITYSEFNANRTWTGNTSSAGSGKSWLLAPGFIALDVWRRIA